ncbi:hypothetical protein [Escherichia coli]|uniref:hypothetical protein n=1 Tax=Escherichia coli TaxID=562 RepID=UPI000BE13D46|nr:hypothetical protein [Escherichia coli]
MKRWIKKATEARFNALWDLIEKEDGVASPYLNNLEFHYIGAMNAEHDHEGGANEFAKGYGFENADHMINSVVMQAEEDYEEKALEWARRV